jgi:hypothetical protein
LFLPRRRRQQQLHSHGGGAADAPLQKTAAVQELFVYLH